MPSRLPTTRTNFAAIAAAQLEAEQAASVVRPSVEEFMAATKRLYEVETGEPAPNIPDPIIEGNIIRREYDA